MNTSANNLLYNSTSHIYDEVEYSEYTAKKKNNKFNFNSIEVVDTHTLKKQVKNNNDYQEKDKTNKSNSSKKTSKIKIFLLNPRNFFKKKNNPKDKLDSTKLSTNFFEEDNKLNSASVANDLKKDNISTLNKPKKQTEEPVYYTLEPPVINQSDTSEINKSKKTITENSHFNYVKLNVTPQNPPIKPMRTFGIKPAIPDSTPLKLPISKPPKPPTSKPPMLPASKSPKPPASPPPKPPTSKSPKPPVSPPPKPPTSKSPKPPASPPPKPPTSKSPILPTSKPPKPPTSKPPMLPTSKSPKLPVSKPPKPSSKPIGYKKYTNEC